jgi:hypothetical protein
MTQDYLSNQAHSLDGGIPRLFQVAHHWPAASDERRYCDTKLCARMRTHE